MKKQLKKGMGILLTLTISLSLCACGQKAETAPHTENTPAGETGKEAEAKSSREAGETSAAEEAIVLKVGTTAPPTTLVSQSAQAFGDALSEVSGGKVNIELITSGALGTTAQHYSQLEQGTLDIFVTAFDTATVMKNSKDFSIFVVPYAFDDNSHLRRFLETDTFNDMLTAVESSNGLKFMGLVGDMLPRCLSTTKVPVSSPDDLKNLKIRTPEAPVITKVWSAWGANPIQTPGSEIYSSLESGIADGQDNDVVGTTSTPLYEVQKYYTELNYIQQCNIMWMSQKTWDNLSAEQQGWVEEAMKKTDETFSTDLFDVQYEEAKKLMEDNGMEFVEFDEEAFRAIAEETAKSFDGKEFKEGLYDYVRSLSEKIE